MLTSVNHNLPKGIFQNYIRYKYCNGILPGMSFQIIFLPLCNPRESIFSRLSIRRLFSQLLTRMRLLFGDVSNSCYLVFYGFEVFGGQNFRVYFSCCLRLLQCYPSKLYKLFSLSLLCSSTTSADGGQLILGVFD